MWLRAWEKGTWARSRARTRAKRDQAILSAIDELAFDWARWQAFAQPEDVVEDQILDFGDAVTFNEIEQALRGKLQLSKFEKWEIVFAAIMQAQTYPERRHPDETMRTAIAYAKNALGRGRGE